ncbi:MAG: hypothetical protein H5U36_05175 [Candidatus Caldatribacterium sp.]|nr:hypothetical protein [Candidatus Caldatribacterium sp.]
MRLGKLSPRELERLVFPFQGAKRQEVVFGPYLGRDCGVLRFSSFYISATCDPVTGTTREAGTLAPHLVANDLIASGAEPVALLVSLLFPSGVSPEFVEGVMRELDETAREIGFAILGGHTEVTDAVTRPIIHCTGIGKIECEPLPDVTRIAPGDSIVMTKGAGIEGTGILALEREGELRGVLSEEELKRAQAFLRWVSVLPEGRIALSFSPHCLHDATEGGVLGAIWEVCSARGLGFEVEEARVIVFPETRRIAEHFGCDPLRLISSGTLLIFTPDPKPLLAALSSASIPAAIIGRVTKGPRVLIRRDGTWEEIAECPQDELWRLFEKSPK